MCGRSVKESNPYINRPPKGKNPSEIPSVYSKTTQSVCCLKLTDRSF